MLEEDVVGSGEWDTLHGNHAISTLVGEFADSFAVRIAVDIAVSWSKWLQWSDAYSYAM